MTCQTYDKRFSYIATSLQHPGSGRTGIFYDAHLGASGQGTDR